MLCGCCVSGVSTPRYAIMCSTVYAVSGVRGCEVDFKEVPRLFQWDMITARYFIVLASEPS